jgi:hypothetical protein
MLGNIYLFILMDFFRLLSQFYYELFFYSAKNGKQDKD